MRYSKDGIIHVKKGEIEYITIDKLKEIKHGFFLRHGGVSKGNYKSLSFKSKDEEMKKDFLENIKKVGETLDIKYENAVKGAQAHTDIAKIITSENAKEYNIKNFSKEKIDALITKEKEIPLAIVTADCTPIIIYDTKNKVVANIHSGWRGTTQRIYLKTAEKMINQYGSKPEDMIVAIGPCIRKCCWTTADKDLIENELKKEWDYDYIEKHDDRYSVDFVKCIILDFIKLGVKEENIIDTNICTCCNNEDFFSFRKNTMLNISEYGLQLTIAEI